jgi:2-methylcitrate dehydratase
MTYAQALADYAARAAYGDLAPAVVEQLKVRVLDSLGCAIGALEGEPVRLIGEHIADFGASGRCTLIGGGSAPPDRAAFYNGALVRYLDFNDSYLAKGETCHPSDNLGAVLAASEYAGAAGREFLLALAVAYQVQCRLSDVAPVRAKGFDHTTQGSYAVAAGVSRALGLDAARTANALAIAGTAFNALRVTRTGALSHWKGLAYPNTAFGCTHAAFLAMRGITGPPEVFEGNKGFMDAIAGKFEIDWSRERLDKVLETAIKKYDAEVHSQSAVDAIVELRTEHGLGPGDVEGGRIAAVEIDTFEVAYNIIGGGEEGDKKVVRSKEEADHSLPYMAAAALLDGELMPGQYSPDRIGRTDVQELLRKVRIRPREEMSARFPRAMPCRVTLVFKDGKRLVREKSGYEGYPTSPARWETVAAKFHTLSAPFAERARRDRIVDAVKSLDSIRIGELTELLGGSFQRARFPRPRV